MHNKRSVAFLLLVILGGPLGLPSHDALGQSGRKQRERLPVKPVQETTGDRSIEQLGGIFYETAEKFQIVFARTYAGKLQYSKKDRENLDHTVLRHQRLDSFITELNRAGRLGYRLTTLINGWDPVALTRPSEDRYEYSWFETNSRSKFEKAGFEHKRAEFAGRGFRIAAHIPTSGSCASEENYDGTTAYLLCNYIDLFLVERRIDKNVPVEQRLVSYARRPGARPSLELSDEINGLLTDRFYPVSILSQLEVLIERIIDRNDETRLGQLRLVRGESRDQIKRRVNELAAQGFRLILATNGVGLMFKDAAATESYSYHWVEAAPKGIMGLDIKARSVQPEIDALQSRGVAFRMTYPDFTNNHSVLIFEETRGGIAKPREYRIFDIEFEMAGDPSKAEIIRDLSRATTSALDSIDRMVSEGFEVRGLFNSDTVKLILEKTRNE